MGIEGSGRKRAGSASQSLAAEALRTATIPLGVGREPLAPWDEAGGQSKECDRQDGRNPRASASRHPESAASRQQGAARSDMVRPREALPRLTEGAAPAVYGAMRGMTRSVSAPVLGLHSGALLEPLFGSPTTETTRQLFVRLLQAQQMARDPQGATQIQARFDLASARGALLRRDRRQDAALESLVLAPVERAFETILTAELLNQLPVALTAPLGQMARAMADDLAKLEPEAQLPKVMAQVRQDQQREYPRPWSNHAPAIAPLVAEGVTPAVLAETVTAILRTSLDTKHACLATTTVLRSCFLGLQSAGLGLTFAPYLKTAGVAYQDYILDSKGRAGGFGAGENPGDPVVGITMLGAPSPLVEAGLREGARAVGRGEPNLDKSLVRDALAYGNPYGSGMSGTANLFLHAAAHFNRTQQTAVDGAALSTLLAAVLCYDGGHSIHEVYAVAGYLRDLPGVLGLNLAEFGGYSAGHARGLFVDLATKYGAVELEDRGFEMLSAQQDRLVGDVRSSLPEKV